MSGEPAVFSPCRQYRYVLRRRVGLDGGNILFIMLNPSTADEVEDDPTIRRCTGFARLWGYGVMEVANLFAWRATNPKELLVVDDPVGPDNDWYIASSAWWADKTVVAWGNRGVIKNRADIVTKILKRVKPDQVVRLGLTRAGQPRHPLYVPRTQVPKPVFPSGI